MSVIRGVFWRLLPFMRLWKWGRRWGAGWVYALTGDPLAAEASGITTEALIRRFQSGQPRAFEALYDRYKEYVYRIAFFILRHREMAEDAVQETFLDVLHGLPHFNLAGPARFETWLYRVTVNRCRSSVRRKVLPSVEWEEMVERLEQVPSPERPEALYLEREAAVRLWQAVDRLGQEHREVLLLRYQHDLSYEEIAMALNIRVGTVRSRLHNAHKKLAAQLGA